MWGCVHGAPGAGRPRPCWGCPRALSGPRRPLPSLSARSRPAGVCGFPVVKSNWRKPIRASVCRKWGPWVEVTGLPPPQKWRGPGGGDEGTHLTGRVASSQFCKCCRDSSGSVAVTQAQKHRRLQLGLQARDLAVGVGTGRPPLLPPGRGSQLGAVTAAGASLPPTPTPWAAERSSAGEP